MKLKELRMKLQFSMHLTSETRSTPYLQLRLQVENSVSVFPTHHVHQCSDSPMFFVFLLVPLNLMSDDMLTTFLVAPQSARRETFCWQIWRKLGNSPVRPVLRSPSVNEFLTLLFKFQIPLEFLCEVVGEKGRK